MLGYQIARQTSPMHLFALSIAVAMTPATSEDVYVDMLRRDEPYAAKWLVTNATRACEGNQESIKPHHSLGTPTLLDCMRSCEGLWGCLAIDYYRETNVCNLYRNACMTPAADHDGASSYRINRGMVWATISQTAACKGSVDLFKEHGHIQSLKLCKQLCENRAGCMAVDYYPVTQVCQMYEEACINPSFVQDGSQSHMIKRPTNWILTSESKGCETNNDRVEVHQKIHLPTGGFPLCKQRCERRSDCRAIDFYHATGWCMIYRDACTHPLSTADGVASWRLLREGLPKPAAAGTVGFLHKEVQAREVALPSVWSTIDADKACQRSGENVQHFKEIQGPEGSSIDECRQYCENNGRCTAVDYFRGTRYCLLYERACTSPTAVHDGASSLRLVRADLAAPQVEFGTAIAVVASGADAPPSAKEIPKPESKELPQGHRADWHGLMRAELMKLDSEGTGFVPVESLRKTVRDKSKEGAVGKVDITEEKLENILSDVATNGGGLVDYEDFLGFATKTLSV